MKQLLLLILSLTSIVISNCALADDPEDKTCEDWINNYGGLEDSKGIRAACRDKMPTVNERLRFERIGTDAFDSSYKVTREYTWLRFGDWISGWTLARSHTFERGDFGTGVGEGGDPQQKGTPHKVGIHKICLVSYQPGTEYNHDNQTEKKNEGLREKVCAYYMQPIAGDCQSKPMISWNHGFIGCVNAPLPAGPETYNPTLQDEIVPIVDTYTQLETSFNSSLNKILEGYTEQGSTFHHPMIRVISHINDDKEMRNVIKLQYKFPGDNSSTKYNQCEIMSTNGYEYCAVVPQSSPGVVCACLKEKCSENEFIGCVPRPTPAQSKLKVVGEYVDYSDDSNRLSPGLKLHFVKTDNSQRPIIYDAENDRVYVDEHGLMYKYDEKFNKTDKLAKRPLSFDRLDLPPADTVLGEQYLKYTDQHIEVLRTDTVTAYGLKFRSLIPQFDSEGNYKSITVASPNLRNTLEKGNGSNCCAYSKDLDPEIYPKGLLPGGKRDTDRCIVIYRDKKVDWESDNCCYTHISSELNKRCDYLVQINGSCENDEEAMSVDCPGLYKGPLNAADNDKICVIQDTRVQRNDTEWNVIGPDDLPCSYVPFRCKEINEPKYDTALAIWPKMDLGESQTGTCDSAYGLTYYFNWHFTLKPWADPDELAETGIQEIQAITELSALEKEANQNVTNIPNYKIQEIINKYDRLEFAKSKEIPSRDCEGYGGLESGNFRMGTYNNTCVFDEGCGSITKVGEITGGTTWTAVSNSSIDTSSLVGTCSDGICKANIQVSGNACSDGKVPKRSCRVTYDQDTGTIYHKMWQQDFTNVCSQ